MNISGKRTLITGAAGGLGAAIARELAGRGAELILTGRNESGMRALAAEVGGDVVVADLAIGADVDRLGDVLDDVEIFVNNAGIGADGLLELEAEVIDRVIDVNLRAPIHLTRRFAVSRIAAGEAGHAVLIGSLSGLAASPNTAMYNATKFGLRGFALAFRQDLHGTGVGLSLVEPGFIRDAGMFADSSIELPPGVRTKSPADVGVAVADAIDKDRAEVFVAPIELRLATTLGGVAPGLSATIQRRLGVADRTADRGR